MKFIPEANKSFLSFRLGDKSFSDLISTAKIDIQKKESAQIDHYEVSYLLPDGLKVTQSVDVYKKYQAAYWVNYFENTSNIETEIISDIKDCDMFFAFDYDAPSVLSYKPDPKAAKVIRTVGSNNSRDEFQPKEQLIFPGKNYTYTAEGGRSSQGGIAPFFDVNRGDKGVLVAIGWTGQWQAQFIRNDTHINIKTGLEDTGFKLFPGEKIRTSSVLLHTYENGTTNAHNDFKRLIKEHFSLIGKPGRPKTGPLCTMGWGGLHTDKMLERIDALKTNNLGFEYYWIDAGWFSDNTEECPNELTGNWAHFTGDWRINKNYHPDEMEDVAKRVQECGMELLLWIEPERCFINKFKDVEHPEWYHLCKEYPDEWLQINALLDLGNEEALNATIELVSGYIEKLGLSCYRQDFNMSPLEVWREFDEPDRRGILEIKHIMGLYKLWDTLLERYPHLIIDNCSSGGMRIDIETLQRSIPMWRSDYQIYIWDCDAECTQCHNAGISRWIPHSGTGAGIAMGDIYHMRSSYSSSMTSSYWAYDHQEFSMDQPLDAIRAQNEEYKRVRPYMSCDFYPIIPISLDDISWGGWQFNRPEESDGIVMAFRRPQSPFENATVYLGGLEDSKTYCFEDADTGERFNLSAQDLKDKGLTLILPEKRSSKLYFYTVV